MKPLVRQSPSGMTVCLLQSLLVLLAFVVWSETSGVQCLAFSIKTPNNHLSTTRAKTHSYMSVSSEQAKKHKVNNNQLVVVVGAGVGGLAVASRIASSSPFTRVIILEKNGPEMAGGRCGSFDVDIIDQEATGKRGSDGGLLRFRHERGPSLLLLKEAYEQLFYDCTNGTKNAKEYGLDMVQCEPAYQVVFEDGDNVELGFSRRVTMEQKPQSVQHQHNEQHHHHNDSIMTDAEKKSRAKMNDFEDEGAKQWDEYMRTTSAFLNCGLPNFIEERLDFNSFPAFVMEALRNGGKSWPLKPHSDMLDAVFTSDKMRALASFQDLYVGLQPYKNHSEFGGGVVRKTAPAIFGLLAALELHPTNNKAGVYAPIGGFRAVSTALQRLAEDCGVQIKFNHVVTAIKREGVFFINKSSKESSFLAADVVVLNADLPFSTRSLVLNGKNGSKKQQSQRQPFMERYDWDDRFDFSSGVVAFHWSIVNKTLDALNTHNVFLVAGNRTMAERSWGAAICGDQRTKEWDAAADDDLFNFYVHRATKTDPTAAPDNCDCIMVLVPCQTLNYNQAFGEMERDEAIAKYKQQFNHRLVSSIRDAVLRRLKVVDGLQDLQSHILNEVLDTPGSYADYYNLAAGAPFGLSHGFGQLSLTRPAAQSQEIDNVFFVGASSRPGNGVPLVLIGAKAVAEKILKKYISTYQQQQWQL